MMEGHGEDRTRWSMQVVALYDHEPEEHDELAFQEGDVLRVVRTQDDGWWEGYVMGVPQRLGLFPSNYVKVQHQRPQEKAPDYHRRRIPQHDQAEDYEETTVTQRPSVRQLKQRLIDAELVSRAAQNARQKAEADRARRHQTSWYDSTNEDEEDIRDDAEDDGFYTQEDWRRETRYDAYQDRREYTHGDIRHDDEWNTEVDDDDRDNEGEDENEEGEEDEEMEGEEATERGAYQRDISDDNMQLDNMHFDVQPPENYLVDESDVVGGDHKMESAIDDTRNTAASLIARKYRRHHQVVTELDRAKKDRQYYEASHLIAETLSRAVQRKRLEQKRQREMTAAIAIQRWFILQASPRTPSSSRAYEGSVYEVEAARKLQAWFRNRTAHKRWLDLLERERRHHKKKKQARKQVELTSETRTDDESKEPDMPTRDERTTNEQEERLQSTVICTPQVIPTDATITNLIHKHGSHVHQRKKVMKKEAIELVKALVTQELSIRLRDHDQQMMEMQLMMSRLQDVIRQQSTIIQCSTDQILEMEQQYRQDLERRTSKAGSLLPGMPSPGPKIEAIAKTSSFALPQLSTSSVPAITRPSGIKPPRPIDRPTKLPLLNNIASSPSVVVKR